MDRAAQVKALALTAALAGCTEELPPLGEAVLIVDTDLSVPVLASELRLDVYRRDTLEWYESRSIPLPDPRDWPVSFSIFNPAPDVPRDALVRLRIHPLGSVRDYRGERFAPLPTGGAPGDPAPETPAVDEAPRLFVGGEDRTPETEPQPHLTIDRLLALRLEAGTTGSVRVMLRGACVGTMADLFGMRSCHDTRGVLLPVEQATVVEDDFERGPTAQGSFAPATDCSAAPREASEGMFDEERCVPGGAYIFGNRDIFGTSFVDATGAQQSADGVPERVAVLPAFRIDRYEVTVARWRRALAEGFVAPEGTPGANEGDLDPSAELSSLGLCTWSASPRGREHYPLNCVSWADARAFCGFYGGDLPSEAEWEYAAQAAGRPIETRYPWGLEEPSCDRAVFGRLLTGAIFLGSHQCSEFGYGPQPVDAAEGDASLGLGLVHLAGGVSELLRDGFLPLTTNCWAWAPLESPECPAEAAPRHSLRGGAWAMSSLSLHPGLRLGRLRLFDDGTPAIDSWIGFRCMRRGQE